MAQEFKSGFVAVVGRPNAGKSTLVNRLVGEKVAIVTSRPQTTRNRIQGIVNRPNAQVVLIDTPGLHRPDSAMGRQMMGEVDAAVDAVDVLALILDASEEFGQGDRRAVERVSRFEGTRILLLNKIDRVSKTGLLPLIEAAGKMGDFAEIIPISALTGDGVDRVLDKFIEYLPVGVPHFPADQYTDQPERFLAAEIIREKVICHTKHEMPYVTAVLIDAFEEGTAITRLHATIVVEKDSQKPIVIGAGAARLKEIGTEARLELEKLFPPKVYLELYVKVQPHWRDNNAVIAELDYRGEGGSEE